MSNRDRIIDMPQATEHEIASMLDRDGAAVLRGVVPMDWVERMRAAIDRELAGASPTAAEYGQQAGRFYGDFFLWLRKADFRDFAFLSPLHLTKALPRGH